MSQLEFSKWHGLGNDYLIISAADLPFEMTAPRAALLCDRHYGVGSDGILLWSGTEASGFRLTIFNPDGSTAEMCGNGMRMLARYLHDRGFADDQAFSVETAAGRISPEVLEDGLVRVHMGRARLGGSGIVGFEGIVGKSEALGAVIEVQGESFEFTFVDMGNPHCVIDVPDPDAVELELLGPALENHHFFPNRTNVEFARQDGPSEVTMRVWERGVGETNACGTGACAVAVAAARRHGAVSPITVHLKGGDLVIDVGEDMEVSMTGPAEPVFDGAVSGGMFNRLKEL